MNQPFIPETESLADKLCAAAAILLLVAAMPLVMLLG